MRLSCAMAVLFPALAFVGVFGAEVELVNRSPFVSTSAAPAPTQGGQIELRGVEDAASGLRFSLLDVSRGAAAWVRLNETVRLTEGGSPVVVRSHRVVSGRDEVRVDYQGRPLTLTLRSAKVTTTRTPMGTTPPPPGGIPQAPPALTQNVSTAPTQASEAARLQDIADELERRRQTRNAEATGAAAPAATPVAPAATPAAPARPGP